MNRNDATGGPARPPLVVRGPRSLAGEVRSQLPWIEAQLVAGYRLEQIAEALAVGGIEISLATLKKNLYRARQGAKAVAAQAPTTPPTLGNRTNVERTAPLPAPPAAVSHMSFEDAMDPRKRAEFADKYLQPKPLIRPAKLKTKN